MRSSAKKARDTEVARHDVERSVIVGEKVIENIESDHRHKFYDEVAAYMSQLKKYPTLKSNEDYAYLFDLVKNGNESEAQRARDLIVYGNIKLVLKIALRYTGRGTPLIDLLQEGVIGLMTAIKKYEIEKGFRFSTYAHAWIRQSITRALLNTNESDPYRIPVHARELMSKVGRINYELYVETGRWPKELQIYERLKATNVESVKNLTLVQVVEALRYVRTGKGVTRLDAPLSFDGSESDETVGSMLFTHQPSTESIVEAKRLYADYAKALKRIDDAIDSLSPRSAMVVRLRLGYGDFDAMTLEEIGQRYDVTRERIRQIEVQAVQSLEEKLGISFGEILEIIEVAQDLLEVANAI